MSGAQLPDCTGKTCELSATAYFDLDALEASYPGQFIGKQLTIRLQITRVGGTCTSSSAQFIAQLVKK